MTNKSQIFNLKYFLIILFSVLSLLFACKSNNQIDGEKILARVNDNYLVLSEIKELYPDVFNSKDSAGFIRKYVDNWVRSKLIYEVAKENVEDDQEIENQLKLYEESMYLHKYEQMLISQKLSNVVSKEESEAYYNEHYNDFVLQEYILRILYIQLSKKIPRNENLTKLMMLKNQDDLDNFKEYCFQNSNKFYFGKDWVSYQQVLSEFPVKNTDPVSFVNYPGIYEASDSLNNYFLKVIEFKNPGETAPFEFVQKSINQTILQVKRNELIMQVRNKIYDKALKSGDFEIFYK